MNLQYADFQHADLRVANLQGADLQHANLQGAQTWPRPILVANSGARARTRPARIGEILEGTHVSLVTTASRILISRRLFAKDDDVLPRQSWHKPIEPESFRFDFGLRLRDTHPVRGMPADHLYGFGRFKGLCHSR